MKILHIGIDSHFVDFMVAGFERHAPGCNELVMLAGAQQDARSGAFTGPTTTAVVKASGVEPLVARAGAADVVVVHAMSDFAALVCAQLPARTVLVWSGFGYDYYVGNAGRDLVASGTSKLLATMSAGRVLDAAGRLVPPGEVERLEPAAMDLVRQFVARRTDYFSAPIDADLEVFRSAFGEFAGEYRQLNYADLASMCRTGDAVATGDDILVGNSSSWSNNHLEAFRVLGEADIGDRKVVVPLTYGDPTYRDAVVQAGERILGESFQPIVEHLPLAEYLDVMSRCGVTVFNHRRQQGVGNVVAALQQGSYVYLNRRNPLYGWLRSHGVDVRSIDSLRESVPSGLTPNDDLVRHRAFLEQMWGGSRVEENLRTFVAEIESRVNASAQRVRRPRGRRAQPKQ